jgi:hypothetical protein
MMPDAELPRFANQSDVIAGAVGVNQFDQGIYSPVKGLLVDLEHRSLRLSRGSRNRARYLCWDGLRDNRHTLL